MPVYYGTVGYYRDLIACFLYIFIGFVEYLCLFAPKLYVLIQAEKNISVKNVSLKPSTLSWTNKAYLQAFENDFAPSVIENISNSKKKLQKRSLAKDKPELIGKCVTKFASITDQDGPTSEPIALCVERGMIKKKQKAFVKKEKRCWK